MRRFSVPEAFLIVGAVVFVVVAFLALELQRDHQQRVERLLAGKARAEHSPLQVNVLPPAPPPAAKLAVTPERPGPARPREPRRPSRPADALDLDACEGSSDPLCGMH